MGSTGLSVTTSNVIGFQRRDASLHVVTHLGLVALLIGCHGPPPPPAHDLAAPPQPSGAVVQLLERPCRPGDGGAPDWLGTWEGERRAQSRYPLILRGPTTVSLTDAGAGKLRYRERAGTTTIELALVIDAQGIAHGASDETAPRLTVIGTQLVNTEIRRRMEIAACVDGDGLHLGRTFVDSGARIGTNEGADLVVLTRPRPPIPPSLPAGVTLLHTDALPRHLVLAGDDLVWVNRAARDSIVAMPRGGGAMRELVGDLGNVMQLVAHGRHVYFADNFGNRIGRVALDGGVETVVDSPATSVVIAANRLVWVAGDSVYSRAIDSTAQPKRIFAAADGGTISALNSDGKRVFIATHLIGNGATGRLLAVPIDGGPVSTLARDSICSPLLVDHARMYWNSCEGRIMGHEGHVRVVAKDTPRGSTGLAMNGSSLIVATQACVVAAVRLQTGNARELFDGGEACVHDIVVAGHDLYLLAPGAGRRAGYIAKLQLP